MKVLRIPDGEKARGMMWALYPIIEDRFHLKIIGFAELQIKQGKN